MDVARPVLVTLALASLTVLSACAENPFSSPAPVVNKPSNSCQGAAIPNRFLVQWKDGSTTIEEAENAEALARDMLEPNRDDIVFAEHDYKVSIKSTVSSAAVSTPADDWGQKDVQAYEAWTMASGEGVTVAVVDSGTDVTHPQLRNQIAVNAKEVPSNQVDDDGNGFIDDYYGYDFFRNSGNIHDGPKGHGTHVAGIIAGEHMSDGKGVRGIAPKAKILPLNFMSDDGSGNIGDAIRAIDYAVARGAKVINASWGGEICADSLRLKISALASSGVLFAVAAGNGDRWGRGYNLDQRPEYPAAFGFTNQITVGAINASDVMTGFSNFSTSLVHIMAPGWRIRSTYPTNLPTCDDGTANNGTCLMDGTSMATPFVSGAAAVVWSYRPKARYDQIKAALIASVEPGDYLVVSKGRLNVRKALDEIAKVVAP